MVLGKLWQKKCINATGIMNTYKSIVLFKKLTYNRQAFERKIFLDEVRYKHHQQHCVASHLCYTVFDRVHK